jgi:tungstate transport system permease protein
MHIFWIELKNAVPLILHGNPYLFKTIWFTLQVCAVATAAAAVIGLPVALALALGRFPGRATLRAIANASLALPPVLVGSLLFVLVIPRAPLASLELLFTRRGIFVAQGILALPYMVALSTAAIQALPPGLLAQARLLGAGRLQIAILALREARIGVMAAVIASLGTSLSEVAAVTLLGGNIYGYDQTLASSTLYYSEGANYAEALAAAIVLIVLILVLMGSLGVLQTRESGIRLRFRAAE